MVVCPVCDYAGNKIEIREEDPDFIQKLITCYRCGYLIEIQNWRRSKW